MIPTIGSVCKVFKEVSNVLSVVLTGKELERSRESSPKHGTKLYIVTSCLIMEIYKGGVYRNSGILPLPLPLPLLLSHPLI